MKAFAFPGQGSQTRGMGTDLFARFPRLVAEASDLLGYDIRDLCLNDPHRELGQTRFTQPALYVVNALSYLARREDDPTPPDVLLGHSLGEYNALFAAGTYDFAEGLRLVARRGELMSQAPAGGMAAVLGLAASDVSRALADGGFDDIDVANLNSPTQTVISGPSAQIEAVQGSLERLGANYIVLNVSAAFHSRAMAFMVPAFRALLADAGLRPPAIPVIANVTAQPYAPDTVAETLIAQICAPVRWTESVRWILGHPGAEVHEVGPGKVLTSLVKAIRATPSPTASPATATPPEAAPSSRPANGVRTYPQPGAGSRSAFRNAYGLRHPCVAAPPGHGLCSPGLIIALARSGVLAVAPGDEGLDAAERLLARVQAEVPQGPLALAIPSAEPAPWLELCSRRKVAAVLPEGFDPGSAALRDHRRSATASGRVLAQVADLRSAEAWLMSRGRSDPAGSRMADDLILSTGGRGPGALTLLPAIRRRRDETAGLAGTVALGVAGEVGTPDAIAALLALGADFVVTGELNICTREAGAPDLVKDLLQGLDLDDLAWAPIDGHFDPDAWRSVAGRGLFFARRARRLHEILVRYPSWEAVPEDLRAELDRRWLPTPFEASRRDLAQTVAGWDALDGRGQMAAVFREYARAARAWAAAGDRGRQADFLLEATPALAAFNRWARGAALGDWRARSAADVTARLMDAAAS